MAEGTSASGSAIDHSGRFSQEFRANWQGSAARSGDRRIRVDGQDRKRRAVLVNDKSRPLIDALVKSGNDTEYRGSVFLLGGRVYPLRLEFSKAKEKTSSIALEWKLPRRAFEVIRGGTSRRCRCPKRSSCRRRSRRTIAASATSAARRSPRRGIRPRRTRRSRSPTMLSPISRNWPACDDDAADREPKLREFCQRFAERAFRRPLTDEQKSFFIDRQFKDAPDPETAVNGSCCSS